MQNNNLNVGEKETLLPAPELLEKYDSIQPGMSKELIKIIKKEQDHRHSLQKKYLLTYRVGQLLSAGFCFVALKYVHSLATNGQENIAYTLLSVFSFLAIVILYQYRKDRINNGMRKNFRRNGSGYNKQGNHYPKPRAHRNRN